MKNPVLFILMGQSNAVGHGVKLEEKEIIETPLKNVFGLTWDDNPFPGDDAVVWRGFVSQKMNLGELDENFGSIVNYLAPMWQNAVDSGAELPDLYIVNISLGSQGVTEQYMWYPEREVKFVPGVMGVADISLTPYSENILSRVKKYFDGLGVTPTTYIHWRGGENDFLVPKAKLETCLPEIYKTMFIRFWKALGDTPKTVLHRIVCDTDAEAFNPVNGLSLVSMGYINNVFGAMAEEFENVEVFDSTKIPGFTLATEERGIFLEDKVHFTAEANKWVAEKIFEDIKKG